MDKKQHPSSENDPTGAVLIAVMQASPYRDIDIEAKRMPMPVREVSSPGSSGLKHDGFKLSRGTDLKPSS